MPKAAQAPDGNVGPVDVPILDLSPYRDGGQTIPYVWSFHANAPGPHALITSLIHGNEPCGAIALDWLLRHPPRLVRGRLSVVFVNIEAYHRFDPQNPLASRYIDEDCNRIWSESALDDPLRDSTELRRARALRPFLQDVDLLLDLHSMQHAAPPLTLAGTCAKGARLARSVGATRLVVMDTGHEAGRRLRDYGTFDRPGTDRAAILVECGQHWAHETAKFAIVAMLRFLRACHLVDRSFGGPIGREPAPEQMLIKVTEAVTVRSDAGVVFVKPYIGGETIRRKGSIIGHDGNIAIHTPYDDCILVMPTHRNHQGQTAVRFAHVIEHEV